MQKLYSGKKKKNQTNKQTNKQNKKQKTNKKKCLK